MTKHLHKQTGLLGHGGGGGGGGNMPITRIGCNTQSQTAEGTGTHTP